LTCKTIVKFNSGEEKEYDADSAVLSGPLLVLHKRTRPRGKLESSDTFPADQVAWVRLPDGDIGFGRGVVKED
jgi:hypothetical protein